ncbi:MAG TPA: tetratricopeptide repeat protein [Blastocatellia bacterium]|nr:tetratricopeptide repeat protein [Blastocatellia bacterium]
MELRINKLAAKSVAATVLFAACALLVFEIVSQSIIGALTDERVQASRDVLAAAANQFPDSSRLHARLARIAHQQSDLPFAESHALRAVQLSPFNYNYLLLLASIEESSGKAQSAEQLLKRALELAPNKTDVRWQLANLLLRRGNIDEALEQFQSACDRDLRLLPLTLNLLWRATNGNFDAVDAVACCDTKARLALASFLVKQSEIEKAMSVFNQLDKAARLARPEGPAFLNALASCDLTRARALWANTVNCEDTHALILNGGFERDIAKEFPQFDWIIGQSDYASFKVTAEEARTGSRSLKVTFAGRDTTLIDGEVKQFIAVRAGARYRLDCYAKASSLATTEGPVIAVRAVAMADWIATTKQVEADSSGWQHLSIEFTVPKTDSPLYITIRRKPRFSYDEPMRGTVLFDDFALTEIGDAR